METRKAKIYVDNKPYEVDAEANLLQACLSAGLDIPYFCWHPALGSVGACRQCAVKLFRNEEDTQGQIVMSCMTAVKDGMRISIDDPEAKAFRASVIEWLMLNHPHDCPVCDEGGECHLQDMTVMSGHSRRNHRFPKRTHRNQGLGPLIHHEMNRCIQCYRCVRYYREYAGGRDLNVFGSHDRVYFGRHKDGVLESEFSGNLVEVCPTGVFTDKTLKRHYTRKWDLQMAPSVCVHCGLGCNTTPGERYGLLRRIVNRYNGAVNGYFLCDRGRFGYEFVNSDRRIRHALARRHRDEPLARLAGEEAIRRVADLLKAGAGAIGIGSPRASLESNFALRALVGPDRFYQGVSDAERRLTAGILGILAEGPARTPSLAEVEQADAALVLGEDLTNSAPRLALALRQSVRRKPMAIAEKLGIPPWHDAAAREALQDEKGPLFIASPMGGKLDDIATATYRAAPNDVARLGFAVAHAVDANCPPVADLPEEARRLADTIAKALKEAERPLVISGPICGSEALIQAAANVAWALCSQGRAAGLCYTARECNSVGLGLLGGSSLEEALGALKEGTADTVIILENDLWRRADSPLIHELFERAKHVVALDHIANATTDRADIVLPAATFAEADGILVNNEARAQRFVQVFNTEDDVQESWRWLCDAMAAAGRREGAAWRDHDDIVAAMAVSIRAFAEIGKTAPEAGFRLGGQRIPRQPPRYSGRTAMRAHIAVSEPKPAEDPDSSLSFSMEGSVLPPPSPLIPFFWSPGWNSIQAVNKFQDEIAGPLRGGDPGVRLIEPDSKAKVEFFRGVPAAFARREGETLIVPLVHIFGSEELSVLSPGIGELSAKPYIAMNPEEAAGLGVEQEGEVEVKLGASSHRLPVRRRKELPRGVAGLPAGLPELKGIALPAWGKILRAS